LGAPQTFAISKAQNSCGRAVGVLGRGQPVADPNSQDCEGCSHTSQHRATRSVRVSHRLTPTSDSLTHLPDPGEIGQVVPVIDFEARSL